MKEVRSELIGGSMGLKKLMKYLPISIRQKLIRSKIKIGRGAPSHIIFKLAETQNELEQAFAVLHDAYVAESYMDAHHTGMRITKYHGLPMTAVLIAVDTRRDLVVGTISIIRNSPLGLPLDSVINLTEMKSQYSQIAEISSLAIHKDYRKDAAEVFWPMMRCLFRYSKDVMKLDAYIIGVHPSRHDLYTGIFGFKKVKSFEAKNYSFVKDNPVAAYVTSIKDQEAWFLKIYSNATTESNWFDYCVKAELAQGQHYFSHPKYFTAQKPVMNDELFHYFFQQKISILDQLSEAEKSYLQLNYSLSSKTLKTNIIAFKKGRKSPRLLTGLNASLVVSSSTISKLNVLVRSISNEGIGLESSVTLPNEVELRIDIGTDQQSHLKLRLRNSKDRFYGFEIISSDQKWLEFITVHQPQIAKKELKRIA